MYGSETRLLGSTNQRIADAALMVGPGLFGAAGLFFGVTKFPKAYDSAFPRNSMIVKKWAVHRFEGRELEQWCMRHRLLLNLTNARPAFFLSVSVFCGLAAKWVTMAPKQESEFDITSRDSAAYYRHLEASMKWALAVYHCHPAYREAHRRMNENSAEAICFVPLPEFTGKRRLLAEKDRLAA